MTNSWADSRAAHNMGFCASGADGITIGFLFLIVLQFGLDKHR